MAMAPSADERFRKIFDASREDIQRYCFRRLPGEDANDATAEVYLVAWKRLSEIPDGTSTRLWLFGVARNVVRNQRRAAARRAGLIHRLRGLAPQVTEFDPPVVRQAIDDRVAAALDALSATDREILLLRSWEGLSAADIACVVDLSVRAVETRLSRTRRRLARALETERTDRPLRPRSAR